MAEAPYKRIYRILKTAVQEYAPSQLHGDGGSRGDFFEGENGHKMNAVGLR